MSLFRSRNSSGSERPNEHHSRGGISIRGAEENNLRSINCDIPRGAVTVVTGPSGAGKSSLVFDTLGREAIRRFLTIRGARIGKSAGRIVSPPRVKRISGLSFTVAVLPREQRSYAPLAVVAGMYDPLRLLFQHFGERRCTNCDGPVVKLTRSEILRRIEELFAGEEITIVAPIETTDISAMKRSLVRIQADGFARVIVDGQSFPIELLRDDVLEGSENVWGLIDRFRLDASRRERLCEGVGHAMRMSGGRCAVRVAGHSGSVFSEGARCERCGKVERELTVRDFMLTQQRGGLIAFPEEVLRIRLQGERFSEVFAGTVGDVSRWAQSFPPPRKADRCSEAFRLVSEVRNRLDTLDSLGLGYLELSRPAHTLSAGEAQKAQLVRWLGGVVQGVTYLLDEPTIGLHPRDVRALIALLKRLAAEGNTVVAVDHDEELLRAADFLIVLGPGAGKRGGRVLGTGSPTILLGEQEIASLLLSNNRAGAPEGFQEGGAQLAKGQGRGPDGGSGTLEICGASLHNLQRVHVSFPLRAFTAVVGVSGSGKSSLVSELLAPALARCIERREANNRDGGNAESILTPFALEDLRGWEAIGRVVDATAFVRMRPGRSTVASVAGLLSPLRSVFALLPAARALGAHARAFSYNDPLGWCPVCRGRGHLTEQEQETRGERFPFSRYSGNCPSCKGRRYRRDIEGVRFRGRSIADCLQLSVEELREIFRGVPEIAERCRLLIECGLSYLSVGQDAYSLSLGEQQRVRIATSLFRRAGQEERAWCGAENTLFIFDEPTRGLGGSEITLLVTIFRRLIAEGGTVIAVDHNLTTVRAADFVVELGPGSGPRGGKVIASGTPAELRENVCSTFGQML